MGLLDDAIREHLELRRRHGADPGEVAREEHDALGPVERGEDRETAGASPDDRGSTGLDGDAAPARRGGLTGEIPNAAQETVEIDMRAILDGDGHEHNGGSETARARGSWTADAAEEMFAWDTPVRARKLDHAAPRGRARDGEIYVEGSYS